MPPSSGYEAIFKRFVQVIDPRAKAPRQAEQFGDLETREKEVIESEQALAEAQKT